MNFFSKRIQSFIPAYHGLKWVFKEANFKIHIIVFVLVMFLAFLLEVNKIELIILLIFSCIVFCTEALNTSIEKLGDAITLDDNEQIKFAKDIGAAAALISAFFSFIVGLWIFLPKIFKII